MNWTYETGREEPEILGSGSNYSYIFKSKNPEEVFEEAKKYSRNYIIRRKIENNKFVTEYYYNNEWVKAF